MSTISSIKNDMHVASCAELATLKTEADAFVAIYPDLLPWFIDHVYREYNKRISLECPLGTLITPMDAGYRPVDYNPISGSSPALLLESGGYILLESGGKILLE